MRSQREGRYIANPLGLNGHDYCMSEGDFGGEKRMGQCYNDLECVATGGINSGYCEHQPGSNIMVDILL